MKVLSKSRFKTGLSCPNKLYFNGDKSFKNKEENNTFLASLAEGGFQVEALARLSYPGGYFVDAPYGAYEKAYKQTLELLKQDEVIIIEDDDNDIIPRVFVKEDPIDAFSLNGKEFFSGQEW